MRFAKAYVEITNVCNLNCDFCPKTKRRPRFLSPEEFSRIAASLRPVTEYLYFHVMGEPLLHPQLKTLLRIAGEQGFRVILTTNGTLLARSRETLLSAPALHKLNLSLHAYEANGLDGEAITENAIVLAKDAAKQGILINFRFWNLDGVGTQGRNRDNDALLSKLRAAFPPPWTPSRGGEKLAERVYLSWSEKFVWPSLTGAQNAERHFCYGLKDQIAVLCDGTVVPCCLDHEGDIPLGNLLTQPLEEILSQRRTQAIIEGFRENRAVEPLCRTCGYAARFFG